MAFYDDSEDEERAELYKLFAGLFIKAPEDGELVQFKDMFQMGFNETPQEIRMDFARLFSDHGARVKPFESIYNYSFGDRPRLWGNATKAVQAFYRSEGLVISEELNPVPDHISLELMFMSYLIEKGLAGQQKEFMEEHMFKWIPDCCDEIASHAVTTFYKEVCGLLKDFITSDYDALTANSA